MGKERRRWESCYSLSRDGLLIDIKDTDLVSEDETEEVQKLNPCGCGAWWICRTEEKKNYQITEIHAFKQWEFKQSQCKAQVKNARTKNASSIKLLKCNIFFYVEGN